jgi:NADPH:quinone reductase-like Zn-dependent oxidoreductase
MRALVVDRTAPGGLRFSEVDEPKPTAHEAVVAVAAFSLNRGEIVRKDAVAGTVPGWDAAGTVVAPAADGSGPPAGARVVTMHKMGGFAERRVINVDDLAVVPDAVSFVDAAALPVAGLTGLGAVRAAGAVVGLRVLITGAAGGVGRFATQFADKAGAYVIASVGSEERAKGLDELGADEVVVGVDTIDKPLDVALDTVGGPVLISAWERLRSGGLLVSIGRAAREDTVFKAYDTPMRDNLRLLCYNHVGPVGRDLSYLCSLVAKRELDTQVDWTGPWTAIDTAVGLLLDRKLRGKAVLTIE